MQKTFNTKRLDDAEIWHKVIITMVTTMAISALPFLFMRIILEFVVSPEEWVPKSLISDFSLVGVGYFLGITVAVLSLERLEGFQRAGYVTIGAYIASVVSALFCWGGYQVYAQSQSQILKSDIDHNQIVGILYYSVTATVVFSTIVLVLFVRDQMRQANVYN